MLPLVFWAGVEHCQSQSSFYHSKVVLMCFSAPASFIAGTTLTIIGIATTKNSKGKSELPFAVIPLLFGAQQLIEGVIWLSFAHEAPVLRHYMTYLYMGFSHVLWPIYVPIAMGFLESVPWRKKAILSFLGVGTLVGLLLLFLIITHSVGVELIGHHMVYGIHESANYFDHTVMAMYVVATCFNCFFSSHGFVRMFGGLQLISFLVVYAVDRQAMFSVWCFFAAILSLLIYIHLRFRNLGGFAKRPFFGWR